MSSNKGGRIPKENDCNFRSGSLNEERAWQGGKPYRGRLPAREEYIRGEAPAFIGNACHIRRKRVPAKGIRRGRPRKKRRSKEVWSGP